jgi:hypothetical protein
VRREGRPAGIPIGRALDVPAGIAYDDLREVIAAIDRVHGDGDLTAIPVRFVAGMIGRGRFRFDAMSGPISIAVRSHQAHIALTLVHEIGHFLDFGALGGGRRFGSAYLPLMDGWRTAVASSHTFHTLENMVRTGTADIFQAEGPRRLMVLEEDELVALSRMLRMEELWACSYAQYIAIRSGHPALIQSLAALRTRTVGRVYYPRQWDADEFAPIATMIDSLMVSLRWRK